METKIEKDLRSYEQPEAEIVTICGETAMMQDIGGGSGEPDQDL